MSEQAQRPYPPRRRRRRRRINPTAIIFWLTVLLVIVGVIALIVGLSRCEKEPDPVTTPSAQNGSLQPESSEPSTEATDQPTEPSVERTGTATVAATGDILMHMPCVRPGAVGDGSYDFTPYFAHLQAYTESVDYAVANLETTLAGLDSGYVYQGYPNFNCPDGIVTSLQEVGFDMLLTANNHTYDTQSIGFFRTQQVIREHGMDHTGTRPDLETERYLIREIDGIQIGMICYTYETDPDAEGVALNGGANMPEDEKVLINTFHKKDLTSFKASLAQDIADMETDGAEAIVLYIHWGEEYQLKQNADQELFAQAACDLGVDVIVGGHPHVIQPMDLLSSQSDPAHKTVCLYSTGNAMSNQRLGNISNISTAHTEDGILFSFSFAKYSDGTVRVEAVEALPLWIDLYTDPSTGKSVYDVLPLDKDVTDWKSALDLTDTSLSKAEDSYDRTMAIIGEGLEEIQTYLSSLPPIE